MTSLTPIFGTFAPPAGGLTGGGGGETSRAGAAAAASQSVESAKPAPSRHDSYSNADGKRSVERSGSDDGAPRKKFSRSRTACLQCRSRKAKCGALPPHPCRPCIESSLTCTWPTEDGRSAKARMQRGNGKAPSGAGGGGQHTAEGDGGDGWMERMLASGEAAPMTGSTYSGSMGTPGFDLAALAALPQFSFPQPAAGTQQTLAYGLSPSTLFSPAQSGVASGATPSVVDPAQFIWAVSSRLPMVEEGSPNDERSSLSGISPATGDKTGSSTAAAAVARPRESRKKEDGKIVKITWWRPHGQTAIAPGLKRYTLKVRVDTPQDTWQKGSPAVTIPGIGDGPQELIAADGMPSPPIMRHLLDVFMTHFGCQFPFLDRRDIEAKIEARTGSVFLFNSIAAIAARFSTHPAIALPDLKPYEYGNVFYNRAKALLGSMLAVPNRETVAAFVLLAHVGFAGDSESEIWMMTGMAVRMSIDAGLHVNPPDESSISSEDRRLNRLVFWSVLLMDYALAFGVGRQTTFRPEDITQTLPTDEDVAHSTASALSAASNGAAPAPEDKPRSPFPFAAHMMASYGPLINMLNREHDDPIRAEREALVARAAAIREYNQLPSDMQWNVGNLQRHSKSNQGSIFLHLHLWMHTIIVRWKCPQSAPSAEWQASAYLTGKTLLRRPDAAHLIAGSKSGAATPNTAAASSLWRNSARTIGDILVLSDIINPHAYWAIPFTNQSWYTAGCCFVKEIEQHAGTASTTTSPIGSPRLRSSALSFTPIEKPAVTVTEPAANASAPAASAAAGGSADKDKRDDAHGRPVDLSRALLTSVATTNISTLQQGLAKLSTYWIGAEWIAGALGQRIQGIQDVDLVSVSEKLGSFVSLPDAGLVGQRGGHGDGGDTPAVPGGLADIDFSDLDFLSLPFDLGALEGFGTSVVEQDVPFSQAFQPEWFRQL